MNAQDVLKYGHQTLLRTLEGLPEDAWEDAGVVGGWSVKDIIAHLASFELVLTEVLGSLLDAETPTPTVKLMGSQQDFNDRQVALRQDQTSKEALAEYENCHARVVALAQKLPLDAFQQNGILPWYGENYDLEDFIVYTFYGHKREHAAQIALYKRRLKDAHG